MAFEHLVKFASRSDIVVTDEMKFFQCIYRWIELQREEMIRTGETNGEMIIDHYVQHVLPLVR